MTTRPVTMPRPAPDHPVARLTPANAPGIVAALMKARVPALLVLLALLPALVILTPLAYASPPDPVWISGFFDEGDHDDVVAQITSTGAALDPFPRHDEWVDLSPADRISPITAPSIPGPAQSRSTSRAPPAA